MSGVKPFIYAHELLDTVNGTGGIWLGCADEQSVKAAHIPCETGADVIALYKASDYDTLRTANQRLETELADANEKIDKAWNRSHQLDSGAYIPGALDAWQRPVLQHLPYDTFGKRDISTSQYCNGWNDAGGYWKAHADDLAEVNQRLELAASVSAQDANDAERECQRLEAAKGDPVGSFDKHMEYMQRCAELTAENKRLEALLREVSDEWRTRQSESLLERIDAALSTANGEVTE